MKYYINLIDKTTGYLLLTSDDEFYEADSAEQALDMFRDKLNQIIAEHAVPDDEDNYIATIDKDGKYLSYVTKNGSHYFHNVESETNDGSSLVTFVFNPDDEAFVLGFEDE